MDVESEGTALQVMMMKRKVIAQKRTKRSVTEGTSHSAASVWI